MKTPELRKAASIALLAAHGIDCPDDLPALPAASVLRRRSADDIARRALACWLAVQAANDRAAGRYTPEVSQICLHLLQRYQLSGHLSLQEAAILSGHGDEQDVAHMRWRYEACWVLLWALGRVPRLGLPERTLDVSAAFAAVADCDGFDAFMQTVRLRGMQELLDEADLALRCQGICAQAQRTGQPAPAGLLPGVCLERHAAFTWLLPVQGQPELVQGHADWDNPFAAALPAAFANGAGHA